VAGGALDGKMVIGGVIRMARDAIRGTVFFVIEVCILPTAGIVACRALFVEMVPRRIPTMAANTIGGIGNRMIEIDACPTVGAMTV
jgi:hypothetical protein